MLEKIKIFILIILPIVILGILSALRNIISAEFLSSIAALIAVVLPSSVATYFSKKFLRNFEKNEKYVAALIFVHPKVRKSFKIFFIASFIFGIAWTLSIITRFIEVISGFGFVATFSTYLVIFALIYFFKTLYEITKSD